MAEVAAGLWAAGEVVETAVQAGIGAYFVAKPTMPLKSTFTQIATSSDDSTRLSLSRSGHTLSIVNNKAWIFGGETATGKLASNEVHRVTLQSNETSEPNYSVVPAIPSDEGAKIPAPRKKHGTCAYKEYVAVFGGLNESGNIIKEDSTIWLFNTTRSAWETLTPKNVEAGPQPRHSGFLFEHQSNLILYGGRDSGDNELKDVWHLDSTNGTWTQLPEAPVSATSAALWDGVLYLVSGTDNMSGDLHYLALDAEKDDVRNWSTVQFPTNPLTPGPRPRTGAGLLPVSTGYGRQYLLYLFGTQPSPPKSINQSSEDTKVADESSKAAPDYWSDMWTCQIKSSNLEVQATTNMYEAIKPAKIKDAIRGAFGVDSGKHVWAEVEVLPPADLDEPAGKIHPGPRSDFACDVMQDRRCVVIWGGINPKGEREGDGWIITLE